MFNKRKQQSARSAQPNWQEPRVGDPAASGAESGNSSDGAPAQENTRSEAAAAPASAPNAGKPPPRPDASAVLNRQPSPPVRPDSGRRASAAAAQPTGRSQHEATDSKKLIVGRDISLAGEIRTCETLVVEGTVEAELNDTLSLEIQDSGLFKGTAVVDTAEIAGRFEGDLTVRKRLYVRATGNVHGTIKYRGLEIESGGRIGGTLTELTEEEAQAAGCKTAEPAGGAVNGIGDSAPAAPVDTGTDR